MNKDELEGMLEELDMEINHAFPGPEKIQVLVVGGACLLFTGTTTRPTEDIDVIITDLFGKGKASLVVNLDTTTKKIRKIVESVGERHGFKGSKKMFLNDDCAPFLIELGDIPPHKVWKEYIKLVLCVPSDLSYILACKVIAGRPKKDYGDIEKLCSLLGITSIDQAKEVVDRYFPDHALQEFYDLSKNLNEIFGPEK
jgi:hypothetical protein